MPEFIDVMPTYVGVMPDLIGHLMIQRLPVKPAMTISSDRSFKMSFRATEGSREISKQKQY